MTLKLISWNLAGLRAAIKKGLCQKITDIGADIYCFQETKAFPTQVKFDDNLKSYQAHWNPATKAGYSGVMTFSRLETKSVIVGDRDNDWDDEGRVIITKFDEFTLLNVYFPNGKRDHGRLEYKLNFYDYFLKYINGLRSRGEKVIFCGDVNTAHQEIDLARPKNNSKTSGFLEIERQRLNQWEKDGWIDTYRYLHPDQVEYSWWDQVTGARKRNVGWRIDYFFIDQSLVSHLRDAFILTDVFGSDHAPVGITLEI